MLGVALLWAQVIPDNEDPYNPQACSKELVEVSRLRRHCSSVLRHPVLDIPGNQDKVRGEVVLVLAGVIVGRITGGHSCIHCSGRAEEGRGWWEGGIGVV
jgi:hypothetical protein